MSKKGTYIDITGMKFNHLTAIEIVRFDKKAGAIWKFQCDCGNFVEHPGSVIRNPKCKIKACGCLNEKGKPKIDMIGKQCGSLKVIRYVGVKGRRRTIWECECQCGKIIEVDGTHLRDGHTKSCGCLSRERIGNLNKKTGMTNTRIHYVYINMFNRCCRPNNREYKLYGGRGIKICNEWLGEHGFENFYEWAMNTGYEINAKRGECTLDRIDVNGNYEPSNCRWVDQKTQCNNRRITKRVIVNGVEDTVANLARKHNINYYTLLHYSKGFPNIKHSELNIEVISHE